MDSIAISGQAAPDGNGTLLGFNNPVINRNGQVAFRAVLEGTSGGNGDNLGIFLSQGSSLAQVVRAGQAAADGNGVYGLLSPVVKLNDAGHVAFFSLLSGTSGGTSDDRGIFLNQAGTISQVARAGQAAQDGNGVYSDFLSWELNQAGQVTSLAVISGTAGVVVDNETIVVGNAGGLMTVVREGQVVPDGNGVFSSLFFPAPNDIGQIAFAANLTGTNGGTADNNGIFRGQGGTIIQIARRGEIAPDGNGTLLGSSEQRLSLNNAGQVAFAAALSGTQGGSSDNAAIYRGDGGPLTTIARTGQAAPDGNGVFSILSGHALNDAGQVAFWGGLTGTVGGTGDDSGVFRGSGGAVTQIARTGQAAPNGNGTFDSFSNPVQNRSGQAAFAALLRGTSGGTADDLAFFTGDGIDLLQVAREGDALLGSTISGFGGFLDAGNLNDLGQIAYSAVLADGNRVVNVWTPDLHWRTNASGEWSTAAHWTLGLNPAQVHDVLIDPAASLTVQGPTTNTSIRSLQIGGGSGLATLRLRGGSTLTVSQSVTVQSTGTLTGDGSIFGNVTNQGTILAENVTMTGNLTNHGIVRGDGRIQTNLFNEVSGEIQANQGDSLWLSGPRFTNRGRVEVLGGQLRATSNVVNHANTGLIVGRDATLRFDAGLENRGGLGFSFGTSDVFGDIHNTSTGSIHVAGTSSGAVNVTFYDDVVQNGSLIVAAVGDSVSQVVMFGSFSGDGGFSGGGDLFALGDLRPGNSPGQVLYDGNLFLGTTTSTFIELAGIGLGEFDQMQVTGDLRLGGDLFVTLIDGHLLGAGQSYVIGDIAGTREGQFNGLDEGALVGSFRGQNLFITYGAGNGNDIALFTAIPEPGALFVLCLAGGVGLIFRRRR